MRWLRSNATQSTEAANDALDASEIDEGAWEFRFVVVDDFDGSEPVFKLCTRPVRAVPTLWYC